jgi:hypothetical protein
LIAAGTAAAVSKADHTLLRVNRLNDKPVSGNGVLDGGKGIQLQFLGYLCRDRQEDKAISYFRFLHVTRSFRI